jgi:MFS family permease
VNSGREIGPFSAIEESTLAHLTQPSIRSDIFAWYTVIGSAGSSCGKLATGWAVQRLETLHNWNQMRAYRLIFLAYAFLGVVNFLLACTLSSKVEMDECGRRIFDTRRAGDSEPLLSHEQEEEVTEERAIKSLFPKISSRSRTTIVQLCLLFAVDSLASGLVPA